jgi:cytosine/uracil/thiamine/allantoin permease
VLIGNLSQSMMSLMQNFVNALSATGLLIVVQVVGFVIAAFFLFKTVKRERRNFTFRGVFEILVMAVFMIMVVSPVTTAGAIGSFLSGAGGVAVSLYHAIHG